MKTIYFLLLSHFIGDYVLQSDYIAKTKGENWWHLVIQSALYTFPFALIFGTDLRLLGLFINHFIIDALKEHGHVINYVPDQFLHQLLHMVCLILYIT